MLLCIACAKVKELLRRATQVRHVLEQCCITDVGYQAHVSSSPFDGAVVVFAVDLLRWLDGSQEPWDEHALAVDVLQECLDVARVQNKLLGGSLAPVGGLLQQLGLLSASVILTVVVHRNLNKRLQRDAEVDVCWDLFLVALLLLLDLFRVHEDQLVLDNHVILQHQWPVESHVSFKLRV